MDALKEIPQVFFDIIARIVPGSTVIFLSMLQFSWCRSEWTSFMATLTGEIPKDGFSASLVVFVFLGGAFTVGHLISPLAKMIDATGGQFFRGNPDVYNNKFKRPNIIYKDKDIDMVTRDENIGHVNRQPVTTFEQYDWLRMQRQEAGTRCARIRAEYIMYYSLSGTFIVFALATGVQLMLALQSPQPLGARAWLGISYLTMGVLMCMRGRDTRKTFGTCVERSFRYRLPS